MTTNDPFPDHNGATSPDATRLALLYGSLPTAVVTNGLLAILMVAVSWPVNDPLIASGWLVLLLLAQAGRFSLWRRYRQVGESTVTAWLPRFRLGAIGTGALWGMAAWLLFPADELAYQVFMAFVLAGLSAGTITSLALDRTNAQGFAGVSLIPLSSAFLIQGGGMSLVMSGVNYPRLKAGACESKLG